MPATGSKTRLVSAYDPSLDEHPAGNTRLLIEAGPFYLNALLTGSRPQELLAVERFTFPEMSDMGQLASGYEDARAESRILSLELPVSCAVSFGTALLVPAEFSRGEDAASLYAFCQEKEQDETVASHPLPGAGALFLFTVPGLIENLLNYWFARVRFLPVAASLAQAAMASPGHRDGKAAWLHAGEGHASLLVTHNGLPVLSNSYRVDTPEDAVYYALFALEQCGAVRRKTPVTLSGDSSSLQRVRELLEGYLPAVDLARAPAFYSTSAISSRVEYHTCFSLFNQHLCV